MYYKILQIVAVAIVLGACHSIHKHDETTAEGHATSKFQYTAYTDKFEVFAEADAFIAGESANVLSHFSILPDFMAVEKGQITLILESGGKEVRQTLEMPTRKGIYSFDVKPDATGTGRLKFEIKNDEGQFEVIVPDVVVFSNQEDAVKAAGNILISHTNTTAFTKEQSWKTLFSTGFPVIQPFGQVIRTAGIVNASPGSEVVVTANINGVVSFKENAPLEGMEVAKGQSLFVVSGSDLSDNNFYVKYTEASNNFEKAKADYERARILAEDKIIADKDLLTAKNDYENARAIFETLDKNFNASGQVIRSPINGFIRQLLIQNGTYVSAGEKVLVISQNKTLVINGEVAQKYASQLGSIQTANIRKQQENMTLTIEELDGKVVSFGKATGPGSYLVPISLEITNNGSFIPGEIVELYLKTLTNATALTVPISALIEEQGNFFVWVQVTPELFEKREVKPGNTDGLRSEILSGLSVSERIVTRGAMMIKLAQATGTLDAHSGHVH